MRVIALTADLATMSRIDGAVMRAGGSSRSASTAAAAVEACAAHEATLLLIDLTLHGLDLATLVATAKALDPPPRLIAFGPHVHADRLATAKAAGCDSVVTRGQFFSQLDAIIGRD